MADKTQEQKANYYDGMMGHFSFQDPLEQAVKG
jgi:hypothetical protein